VSRQARAALAPQPHVLACHFLEGNPMKAARLFPSNGDVLADIRLAKKMERELDDPAEAQAVLDNQKSVSVLGTYLQNASVMEVIYREGYTDIEMEGGPYLSAIAELSRPTRHPVDEIVNLYGFFNSFLFLVLASFGIFPCDYSRGFCQKRQNSCSILGFSKVGLKCDQSLEKSVELVRSIS